MLFRSAFAGNADNDRHGQAGPDANAGQTGGGQSSSNQGDNVQDADFEEVK